ncbi:hypothetical protein ACS0TY_016094 [Phlomoides rotata]
MFKSNKEFKRSTSWEDKIFKEETTIKESKTFKANHKGNFLKTHKEGTMLLQTFKEVLLLTIPTSNTMRTSPTEIKRPRFNFHRDSTRVPSFLTKKGRPSQDELLELMFEKMMEKDVKMDEFIKATNNQIKTLEHQMGQMASNFGQQHQKGKFPSTTKTNPREHCKAIKLRSGTRYDGPSNPLDEEEVVQEDQEEGNEDSIEEEELELANEDEEDKSMGTEREKKKEQ